MRKTFKFKLYNSKKNKRLHKQIELACEIYNHCIAFHKQYYQIYKKHLNMFQLQNHLTRFKKFPKYQHWKNLGSQAIQDITNRIDEGYQLFFKSLKTKRKVRPPSFRKRQKYKSFTLKQAGYKLLETNKIRIGKKLFKFHKSREIEGIIKTLTIKRDPLGDIYLFFSCEVPENQTSRVMTGKDAGFDFGLKTFLTSSDDMEINAPLFFKQGLKEIRKASKNLSRKKKGSNNRKKAKLNLVRKHKRIANQRNDYHFKLAKKLAEKYDYLFFEDLNIEAMKRLWGRKISDLGFSNFICIQKYYCRKTKSIIHFIDRFYASTQICNICGYVNHELSLKDRYWICPVCKTLHKRDKNSAINIHREGASSLGLGDIRLPSEAISA